MTEAYLGRARQPCPAGPGLSSPTATGLAVKEPNFSYPHMGINVVSTGDPCYSNWGY